MLSDSAFREYPAYEGMFMAIGKAFCSLDELSLFSNCEEVLDAGRQVFHLRCSTSSIPAIPIVCSQFLWLGS